jgi:hypothetical protein
MTNSQSLIETLNDPIPDDERKYTLKTGEYFIFKIQGESAFTLLGEGNSLISKSLKVGSEVYDTWFNQDWDSIIEGDLPNITWATNNGDYIKYL